MECWLCQNSGHEEAKEMHRFILRNVSSMSADIMAGLISEHLATVAPAGRGLSKADVHCHIQGGHLLNPSLQMAHTLRSLFELRDTIQGLIVVENEDGVRSIDARNMATYLKVISEIVQVYKTGDVAKLMFSGEDK